MGQRHCDGFTKIITCLFTEKRAKGSDLRHRDVRDKAQRHVSKQFKGSKNREKAQRILGKRHLKISRQREDHAVKLARCVIESNDLVAHEDLRINNMVKNHCLAQSINDASWHEFRVWLEYFAKYFGKTTIAVTLNGTSQECSNCGTIVKKALSTRTHVCLCGCVLDRDHNAARNILMSGIEYCRAYGNFCT
jgi:putative transposase